MNSERLRSVRPRRTTSIELGPPEVSPFFRWGRGSAEGSSASERHSLPGPFGGYPTRQEMAPGGASYRPPAVTGTSPPQLLLHESPLPAADRWRSPCRVAWHRPAPAKHHRPKSV